MFMLWHNKEIMFSLQRPLKKRNKFPMERWKHMDLMDYDKEKKYLEKIVGSNIKQENRKEWGDKG